MSHQRRPPFLLTSEESGVETEFETANEIVEFYRRYRRQTDEALRVERADLPFELPDQGTLENVIAALEPRYEREGVPIGVVVAAMGRQGLTVGETLAEIHDVRMIGALYEPRDDHLAVV